VRSECENEKEMKKSERWAEAHTLLVREREGGRKREMEEENKRARQGWNEKKDQEADA
jgi:hypothetical protein